MKYRSLNDAVKNAKVDPRFRAMYADGPIRIWYAKRPKQGDDPDLWEYMRDVRMGLDWMKRQKLPLPTPNDIWRSHTKLGSIQGSGRYGPDDMEDVFMAMQGEIWSPEGEANSLIRGLDLAHTSMSVGDIVQPPDGTLWFVDTIGFTKIWPKRNPSLRRGKRPKRNPSDLRSIMRKYG